MSVAPKNFHFISIQGPNDAKDQTMKRQARSHAVKCGLEKKRKLQQSEGDNFRSLASSQGSLKIMKRRVFAKTQAVTLSPLLAGMLDPFQALAVDSSRLQTLLGDYKARQAPEPVFSVAEELAFQNFRSVFRTGFTDPALLNAIMLSLVFATTGGCIDRECLVYQIQAISHIRERMNLVDSATSESTIGAILLLAGVEARLGLTTHVQLHIGAVQLLLQLSQAKGVQLTSGIKRAIFWQDLNCSILTGSRRMVDHKTFAEIEWRRESFPLDFFRLSMGFQERSYLLSKDLLAVLEDVQALQCVRDVFQSTKGDVMPMSHLATRLLQQLKQTNEDVMWDDHLDLLLWLLYIGGAFVPSGTLRSEYTEILRSNNSIKKGKLCKPWPQQLEILKNFIWSENAFRSQVKTFWEETIN